MATATITPDRPLSNVNFSRWFFAASALILVGLTASFAVATSVPGELRFLFVASGFILQGLAIQSAFRECKADQDRREAGGANDLGIPSAFREYSAESPTDRSLAVARPQPFLSMGLLLLYGLGAVAVTAVAIGSWFDVWWAPAKPPLATFLWLLIAPLCLGAIRSLATNRGPNDGMNAAVGKAGFLLLGMAVCILGWIALPGTEQNPIAWKGMRIFLRAIAVVCFLSSALVLQTPGNLRLAVMFMVVTHFGGICSAALASPPTPWIVGVIWTRLYRPYLEFLYLNNAYHFYSPEPGPSSHMWFRLVYVDQDDQTEYREWYKIPEIDQDGHHLHNDALEYQRHLAMAENTGHAEGAPPSKVLNEAQEWVDAPYVRRRLDATPGPLVVGRQRPAIVIPLHPFVPFEQQYYHPNQGARDVLKSFAMHVCQRKPQTPGLKNKNLTIKGVKIYRAVHSLPPYQVIGAGISPNDPEFFRPYFLGYYDPSGKLIDDGDPFLYWLLPILRDNSLNPDNPARNYAAIHAGDPNNIWRKTLDGKSFEWAENLLP